MMTMMMLSDRDHQQTNTQLFRGPMAFPSLAQPRAS